jgi:putative oxidoreductase
VALGLFTRPAALICSGSMAYAYFTVHQPTGLLPIDNNGEPSALFAWIFLLLAVFGPGPWALERLLPAGGTEAQPRAAADQGAANA